MLLAMLALYYYGTTPHTFDMTELLAAQRRQLQP